MKYLIQLLPLLCAQPLLSTGYHVQIRNNDGGYHKSPSYAPSPSPSPSTTTHPCPSGYHTTPTYSSKITPTSTFISDSGVTISTEPEPSDVGVSAEAPSNPDAVPTTTAAGIPIATDNTPAETISTDSVYYTIDDTETSTVPDPPLTPTSYAELSTTSPLTAYETIYTSTVITLSGGNTTFTEVPASTIASLAPAASFAPNSNPSISPFSVAAEDALEEQGTQVNADGLGQPSTAQVGFGLAGDGGVDYRAARLDHTANPELYEDGTCVYTYRHVLGGDGTLKLGDVFSQPGSVLTAKDVDQGGLGDCGLGASVLAMLSQGHTNYLKAMTRIRNNIPQTGDRGLTFVFRQKTNIFNVRINDELAAYLSGGSKCSRYIGFDPVPAVGQTVPAGQTRVFFMGLLEKAWAKYLDAYPQYRADSVDDGVVGYGGIIGTRADFALAAFTGGDARRTRHENGERAMVAHLKACLTTRQPCVIGIPSFDAVDRGDYGTFNDNGFFYLRTGNKRNGKVEKVILDDGSVYEKQFRIIDYDNPLNGVGRPVRLALQHAYGVDVQASEWNDNLSLCRVTFVNPWGRHPVECAEKKEGCKAGTSPAVELSCSVAVKFFSGIFGAVNRLGPVQ